MWVDVAALTAPAAAAAAAATATHAFWGLPALFFWACARICCYRTDRGRRRRRRRIFNLEPRASETADAKDSWATRSHPRFPCALFSKKVHLALSTLGPLDSAHLEAAQI